MKKENVSIFEQNEEYQKPTYKFIGIVFNTYIIPRNRQRNVHIRPTCST